MKKAFVAFSVLIITLLCSISVFAMDTDDSGMWEYQPYGTGVELTKYNGTQTDVYAPSKIKKGESDYSVLKLGDNLFKGNTALNSATLGEGITEIGASAFEGATNLVCIVASESLTTIGDKTFSGCTNFNSVILYDAVTSIEEDAFDFCDKLIIYCNKDTVAYKYAIAKNIDVDLLNSTIKPETHTIDGITYYIQNGEANVVHISPEVKNVVLPAAVEGFPVTNIKNAFRETNIEKIELPDTIKSISWYAFADCKNLKSVKLPEGITHIDRYVFQNCESLEEINIPTTISAINDGAFKNCLSLTSIYIPSNIKEIYTEAFYNCINLKTVSFSEGLTYLGLSAFENCKSLNNINFPESLKQFHNRVFANCSNITNIIWPESLTSCGSSVFEGCTSLKNVILPQNLTSLSTGTFKGCSSLISIVVPDEISRSMSDMIPETTIWIVNENSNAHKLVKQYSSKLYHVTKNGSTPETHTIDGITYYIQNGEANVVHVSPEVKNVVLPATVEGFPVTNIKNAFRETNIEKIELPDTIKSINWYAFADCKNLKSVKLPEGITHIDRYVFQNCESLEEINIPTTISKINDGVFENCLSLTSISIPSNIKEIYTEAFYNCVNLKTVSFSEGLTYLGESAFENCKSLNNIIFPETLKQFHNRVFANCTSLTQIVWPKNLSSSGSSVFEGCTSIKSVILPQNLTSLNVGIFKGCSSLISIVVPDEISRFMADMIPETTIWIVNENSNAHKLVKQHSSTLYHVTKNGSTPETHTIDGITYYIQNGEANVVHVSPEVKNVVLPATVEGFPVTNIKNAFRETNIEKIELPVTIKSINWYAFADCKNLKSVKLPEGITHIDRYVFQNCESLEEINIPTTISKINDGAFKNCLSLTSIYIPSNIKEIYAEVFYNCINLKTVSFSEGLTYLGPSAFENCKSLNNINFPESLKQFHNRVFANCSNITNIIWPESLTSCGSSVFEGCTSLKNVILPQNLTSLNVGTFKGCSSLISIVVPDEISRSMADMIPETTIWIVNENSNAHKLVKQYSSKLYCLIGKRDNPDIYFGKPIEGRIRYSDGTYADKVQVSILYDDGTLKETTVSNARGMYNLIYAEVGRYTIRATDSDGNTASEVVSVKRMNVFDVYIAGETDLVLKKGCSVSGTVTPATAKVTISDTNGNIIKSVDVTNGTFTFTDIPRGSYIVKAENETGSAMAEIYVSNEDVTGISLEVKAQSATVTGDTKIENRDGTYSAKIWVNIDLIDDDGNVVASTKTDADGKYVFNNVPAGRYNIVASANEIRPDIIGGFDKIHELKGYGHIDVTEFITYTVDTIILREDKVNLTSVSGKVTANGTTQDCKVILTNENGDQIAVFVTDKNGKYNFVNIPDGMYCITAITKVDGMGFAVITIENGVVHGDTDIKVAKADKISKREPVLLEDIPDFDTKEKALMYKEAILAEKRFYDSLSEKKRKQLSEEWLEKLFKLLDLIFDSSINAPEGVTVDNVESVISADEIDETITFALSVTEASVADAGEDGITTEKEYETEKIKDKKGKNKNIAKYYDITFSKDGQNISNIQKQTETNGKLRITMDIPEEYRGHKHYSFIHMHKGEAVTLVDLDDNPDTVTFEIDKFSTFALAYSDVELVGEVEETIYPASITYNAETGKISVSSTETGTLYIATYNGDSLSSVVSYDVVANASANDYDFSLNQAAFVWMNNLKPLCNKFTINK